MNNCDSSALETIWVAEVCNCTVVSPQYFYALLSGSDEVAINGLAEVVGGAKLNMPNEDENQWIVERLREDLPETLDPSQEYYTEMFFGIEHISVELRAFAVDKEIEEYDIDLSSKPTHPIHRGDIAYAFIDGEAYGVFSVPVDEDETLCLPLKVY